MNGIEETVHLPDPDQQLLVHPLDLHEARSTFVQGWLIARLTDPPVALCLAALVWFASRNVIAPLAAGLSTIVLGRLAAQYRDAEAWAHVPRRRQDRDRAVPVTWELAAALLFAGLLAVVLLLVVNRLGQGDVPEDVRQFTLGMAGGAAMAMVVDVVVKLVTRPGARRRTWLTLPGVVAVVACVIVAAETWLDDVGSVTTGPVLWGVVTMLVISGATGIWQLVAGGASAR